MVSSRREDVDLTPCKDIGKEAIFNTIWTLIRKCGAITVYLLDRLLRRISDYHGKFFFVVVRAVGLTSRKDTMGKDMNVEQQNAEQSVAWGDINSVEIAKKKQNGGIHKNRSPCIVLIEGGNA